MGFAEFAAKLISEVFDAIVTSQFDQEKRLAELATLAALPVEEFAERFVTDEQIDSELARLFPGEKPEQPTAIYVGAPYRPRRKDISEQPPIYALLGVSLEKGDYAVKQREAFLTANGVEKIKSAVRQQLALNHYTAIREIIRRGLPRIIADAGRVNAKLTYEVLSIEEAARPERAARLAAPLQPLTRGIPLPEPTVLSKLRLIVRPADERVPQNQKLQVNVFGEVEISFKTVT